jgi:hypothetical protein
MFELLDVARRTFNGSLSDTIDMLRLVDAEPAAEQAGGSAGGRPAARVQYLPHSGRAVRP